MRMLRTYGLVTAIFAASFSCIAAAEPADSTLPQAERVFIASKIYSLIPIFFAHWKGAAGLDLDAAYREYLNRILSTDDRVLLSSAYP